MARKYLSKLGNGRQKLKETYDITKIKHFLKKTKTEIRYDKSFFTLPQTWLEKNQKIKKNVLS